MFALAEMLMSTRVGSESEEAATTNTHRTAEHE
jgi:hypothetical protein